MSDTSKDITINNIMYNSMYNDIKSILDYKQDNEKTYVDRIDNLLNTKYFYSIKSNRHTFNNEIYVSDLLFCLLDKDIFHVNINAFFNKYNFEKPPLHTIYDEEKRQLLERYEVTKVLITEISEKQDQIADEVINMREEIKKLSEH